MDDLFPHFSDPQLLPDGRTWTAEYESFNPRTDDVYYYVTLGGGVATSYFVRVSTMGYPEREKEWEHVRQRVALHAEAGVPNTEYEGSVPWQMRRGITS